MAKIYTHKAFNPQASDLNHKAYIRGCKHFDNGSYIEAAKSFQSALEYWPRDPQAWLALGNCYDELQNPVKAEEYFRRALQYCSNENRGDITYNLGNALMDQRKNGEAITCFAVVPRSAKSYERAQKNLIEAKLRLQDDD
jgi:Tfp pilus assembly protein PilF